MDGMTVTIGEALALHQAGDLQRAAIAYQQILASDPTHSDALHLSGVIAHQQGQNEQAVELIQRAVALQPEQATFHSNLGAALQALRDYAAAERHFQLAVQLNPNFADARFNLGALHQELQQWEAAIADFAAVIRLQPGSAQAYYRLGSIFRQQGQHSKAIECLEQAVHLTPQDEEAVYLLAVTLREAGNVDRAIDHLRRLCWQNSEHVAARFELATLLHGLGRLDESIACYNEVIQRDQRHVQAFHNLGIAHTSLLKFRHAEDYFRQALQIDPTHAASHNGLGSLLREQGHLAAAVESFQKSIQFAPQAAEPRSNLAGVLQVQGCPEAAVEAYRLALAIDPGSERIHSNLLMALHYEPEIRPDEFYQEHLRWQERHLTAATVTRTFRNVHDPHKRLRIGYLSADFRAHSVAYFMQPLLAGHDRERVEVTCYSDVAAPDTMTQRLQQHAEHWKNVYGLSNKELLRILLEDEIDILVDLAGHTGGNRLQVLAQRAAPIQVTHLGYGSTTGVPAIDYRLSDEIADPSGESRRHTEELVSLPTGIFCYGPPPECPPVAETPPCSAKGYVTFGSFNNLAKISERVVDLWAEILSAVPDSRLLMKNNSFTDTATQNRYRNLFAERGIATARLEFQGQLPSLREHLEQYGRIDIALDSFPYTGATTTCETLWMGVPVVTLRGNHYIGRMSASLLTRIECEELIADSPQEYLQIACRLAANPQKLTEARGSLRQRMSASEVCDADAAARGLEECYREMWQHWCTKIRKAG